MKEPVASKVKAAGIGGLLAGVPVGAYLGNLVFGLAAVQWPETIIAIDESPAISLDQLKSAVSGIFTVLIAVLFAWSKREKAYGQSKDLV
jgi:hypothetical protein